MPSSSGLVKQGLKRLRRLRPRAVRQNAAQPFHLDLVGVDDDDRAALASVFVPFDLDAAQRRLAVRHLYSGADQPGPPAVPLVRVHTPAAAAADSVVVDWRHPQPGIAALLDRHPQLQLPLGRVFPPLREAVAQNLIRAVAGRNAALAALSALPEVIPSPASLIFALGELGSDTILLSANQIGLSFELAALEDAPVGWLAQNREVLAILVGALGWRTLARTLVSLVPAGVGLAAKSAIAYSGTVAVGKGLWSRRARRGRRLATVMEMPAPRPSELLQGEA